MLSSQRFIFLTGITAALLTAAACGTDLQPGGRPLPQLTFSELSPLQIGVGQVVVDDQYNPSADPQDISSRYPGPPNKALATYAYRRLQASGGSGILHFVIEDASVRSRKEEQDLDIARTLKLGESDRYTISMKLGMYVSYPDHDGPKTTLTFGRGISIPRSGTLAEKEMQQLDFLEEMMRDVDKGVTTAVNGPIHDTLQRETMRVQPFNPYAGAANSAPPASAYGQQPAMQQPMPLYSNQGGNNEDSVPAPLPDPSQSPF
jgi:hypothetical protein